MAFNPHPTAFQTKLWRDLYESFILDLGTLKIAAANGASFVCIDAEPWGTDTSRPAEIGISFVADLNQTKIRTSRTGSVASLDDFSLSSDLETHRICIVGRERQEKYRQKHRYGLEHVCEVHGVEQLILDLIGKFRQKPSKLGHHASLILTVFSHTFEFRMLSAQYPQILTSGIFTSWLDLQALAAEASIKDTRLIVPSLQETLAACGIKEQDISRTRTQHNSATDTVRIAALLSFIVDSGSEQQLDIKCSSQKAPHRIHRKDPTTKKNWNCRPNPSELFPYAAKVWQETSLSELHSAQALRQIFQDYEPVAVGLHKDKRHGWVCLKDLESLEKFVRRVHHSTVSGIGGTWFTASLYDPEIARVGSLSELKAIRNEAVHTRAEEKREQRRLKKENVWLGKVHGDSVKIDG